MNIRYFFSLFLFVTSFTTQLFAEDWQRVYLATYPRSGNHWMRYLIEEVTHIATGSVYCDSDHPVHMPTHFPWGYAPEQGYEGTSRYPNSADIVVIKTHYPVTEAQYFDCQPCTKVIRIVRHPIDSFYSFYVFGKQPPFQRTIPRGVLLDYIKLWKDFQNYWNSRDDVFTVRYEDLLTHPKENFKRILENIGYPFTEADIERSVNKYPPKGNSLKHLRNFTRSDIALIRNELKDLMIQFNYQIPHHTGWN